MRTPRSAAASRVSRTGPRREGLVGGRTGRRPAGAPLRQRARARSRRWWAGRRCRDRPRRGRTPPASGAPGRGRSLPGRAARGGRGVGSCRQSGPRGHRTSRGTQDRRPLASTSPMKSLFLTLLVVPLAACTATPDKDYGRPLPEGPRAAPARRGRSRARRAERVRRSRPRPGRPAPLAGLDPAPARAAPLPDGGHRARARPPPSSASRPRWSRPRTGTPSGTRSPRSSPG